MYKGRKHYFGFTTRGYRLWLESRVGEIEDQLIEQHNRSLQDIEDMEVLLAEKNGALIELTKKHLREIERADNMKNELTELTDQIRAHKTLVCKECGGMLKAKCEGCDK